MNNNIFTFGEMENGLVISTISDDCDEIHPNLPPSLDDLKWKLSALTILAENAFQGVYKTSLSSNLFDLLKENVLLLREVTHHRRSDRNSELVWDYTQSSPLGNPRNYVRKYESSEISSDIFQHLSDWIYTIVSKTEKFFDKASGGDYSPQELQQKFQKLVRYFDSFERSKELEHEKSLLQEQLLVEKSTNRDLRKKIRSLRTKLYANNKKRF